MKVDMEHQTDTACRLRYIALCRESCCRAAEGLASIAELDPGFVTGPLSVVWRALTDELVEDFDLGPDKLIVASYDWRIPPSRLQQRDLFFWKLMRKSACNMDGI